MIINITPQGVIESTVMYGVVHGIWIVLKRFGAFAEKEARKEEKRLIALARKHRKSGHDGHFYACTDVTCQPIGRLGSD